MKQFTSIQAAMFAEMAAKKNFDQAQKQAYSYLDTALERNIYPSEEALEGLKQFEEALPERPTNTSVVLEQLHTYGSPATVPYNGRYFGFVNGGVVPAGLAARLLSDFWDQNSVMYVTSPIVATLETVVERWLKELFNLPEQTVAGFVSGTSTSTFCGLAAARYRLLQNIGWDINEEGLFGAPPIRIVTSKHIHSSVKKAINLLGFGNKHVEYIEVDEQGRIIPDLVPELDNRTLVILQAGNVNSGSFDSFEEICQKARTANAWVHIDGAFGMWAGAVSALKHLTKGMALAHSWSLDGHKTLNTPYDGAIILCADQEALVSALHMSGSYLILSEKRDGMLYTPEMSRRGRIVEIWATMKYLGKTGIDEMIYGMHQRAVQFAREIHQVEGFEVLNDVVFNQVMVACETDALTENTMKTIQDLRECWAGGSSWNGRKVIRISVCSWATRPEDITRSVQSFAKALELNKTIVKS